MDWRIELGREKKKIYISFLGLLSQIITKKKCILAKVQKSEIKTLRLSYFRGECFFLVLVVSGVLGLGQCKQSLPPSWCSFPSPLLLLLLF